VNDVIRPDVGDEVARQALEHAGVHADAAAAPADLSTVARAVTDEQRTAQGKGWCEEPVQHLSMHQSMPSFQSSSNRSLATA